MKDTGDSAWSPDGARIAFASDRDGDSEIYVMSPDGSDVMQLTRNDFQDSEPTWQPIPVGAHVQGVDHRFKESGQPARYELFDQVCLSPSLVPHRSGAMTERRTKHSGDGSDHDPGWVVLDL